ncbi:MAG: response regulator [Terracidiphilus sp.]|jgi:CheY-like chemotaxis protein
MPNTPATLLIVDDDPSIRELLSQVLSEIGYSVRTAEGGISALREIQNEVPGLLVSDLNMPGMSGFELLAVIRRRFPEIRTIAMSGSFSGDEVPSGVAADAYFQKGSSIAALLRIMETLPQLERKAHPPTSSDAPLWIHSNTHDLSPDKSVTITCPECLRTFSETLGTGGLNRKIDCIYCHCSIHYAIVQQEDRMPSTPFERMTAEPSVFSPSSPNFSC